MKPMNFPGRKNDRRKKALQGMSPSDLAYEPTKAAILDDGYARSLRTKKDHTHLAKLRRDKV